VVFGGGLYWRDNLLALLPPSLAFWGLTILYYLFTHLYIPERRSTFLLIVGVTVLWLVASITAHNLGRFVNSGKYTGLVSALTTPDFWYSYICSLLGCSVGIYHFVRFEPLIVAKIKLDKAEIQTEGG